MFKHGHSRRGKHTRENQSYWNMMGRCHRPQHPRFKDYGARGVIVCERWRNGDGKVSGFECFLADMGLMPSVAHTIERTENDKGYTKENCRWATRKEQSRNRRSNIIVKIGGKEMILAEAAENCDVGYKTVWRRVSIGWDANVALSAPLYMKKTVAHAKAGVPASF